MIGLGGGSASGKTTLARTLQQQWPEVALLSLDDFFLQDTQNGPFITVDGRQHFNLNHPGAVDIPAVLAALDRQDGVKVMLLEGHLALAIPELRERMTLKVYVHVSDDLRLRRKIVRNFEERGQAPAVTFQNYLNSGQPGHDTFIAPSMKEADLILDGTRPTEENVSFLLERIRKLTSSKG